MTNLAHYDGVSASDLDTAWQTLKPIVRSPLIIPNALTSLTKPYKTQLTIVSESFQYTGSFKFRAAYNLLQSIPEQLVITASSGNFGQAIAYTCQLLKKQCIIVMPTTSAQVKIDAIRSYGGTVDLVDTQNIGRQERVEQLLEQYPDAFFAPAYDHPHVVAGNSTLARQILEHGSYDAILVPIGGGGLISGFTAIKDYFYADERVEIVGVEPLMANDAARSLRAGQPEQNEGEPLTLADGARTNLGVLNWQILHHALKDIIEVSEEAIANALRTYFLYNNLKVEPTGALTLAAYLSQQERFANQDVCCVVSGGNVDPAVYARLITEGK